MSAASRRFHTRTSTSDRINGLRFRTAHEAAYAESHRHSENRLHDRLRDPSAREAVQRRPPSDADSDCIDAASRGQVYERLRTPALTPSAASGTARPSMSAKSVDREGRWPW